MKKISLILSIVVLLGFTACNFKGKDAKKEGAETKATSEEASYSDKVVKNMDSLLVAWITIGGNPLEKSIKDGSLKLTKKQKEVKPDYLLPLDKANSFVTIDEKMAGFFIYSIDMQIARLYDMPVAEYNQVLAKLATDIGCPAFSTVLEPENADLESRAELVNEAYTWSKDNQNLDVFCNGMGAALIETIYILNQDMDVYMSGMDDEGIKNIMSMLAIVNEATLTLQVHHPELVSLTSILVPFEAMNAQTVAEFRTQVEALGENIDITRNSIIDRK